MGARCILYVITEHQPSGIMRLELMVRCREGSESKEVLMEEIPQEGYNELDPSRPNLIGVVFSGKHCSTINMEAGLVMCEKIGKG